MTLKKSTILNSLFTISLDFELHWGGFEKWPLADYRKYFDTTRALIPKLLKAFEVSHVHATWATVGLLLHKDRSSLLNSFPDLKPQYVNQNLSAYNYINQKQELGENEQHDPYHYAHSLIKQITQTPGQELASHSFAHYYCNEAGQTVEQFEADANAWNKAAEKYGIKAKSIVFPRNQFNADYLNACEKTGIQIARSNPQDWWWKIDSTESESLWKRLNRGADAYVNIGGKTSYKLTDIKEEAGVWLMPASRLLRPYNPKELFLNNWKINKIKREMTSAAQANECYHLWWHPHNFGNYPKENMAGLIEILNHFNLLHKRYGMESRNMAEVASIVNNG